jgi:hypothetical protein
MKKLLFFFVFMVASIIGNCQVKDNIQAQIAGYKYNDTIKVDDFLRIGELSLNSKEYSIESFSLSFTYGGFNMEYKSNSKGLTEEMKKELMIFSGKKDLQVLTINLFDISITKPKTKPIKIGDLIYRLKMK